MEATAKLIRKVYPREGKSFHRRLRAAMKGLSHKEKGMVTTYWRLLAKRGVTITSQATLDRDAIEANRLG